jgi:hypothetical protein
MELSKGLLVETTQFLHVIKEYNQVEQYSIRPKKFVGKLVQQSYIKSFCTFFDQRE